MRERERYDRDSERSHRDRPERSRYSDRDRDHDRDRDRDRERDRRDKDRERDRNRDRDRDRDRDRERERPKERERERDRDRDHGRDHGRDRELRDRNRIRRPTGASLEAAIEAAVPVDERKRRMTMWDIKPKGYEQITAEQAKLSGLFPLPGAPRQQNYDQARMQLNQNGNDGGNPLARQLAVAANLQPSNSRQSKRVLVSNLPHMESERHFVDYINKFIGSIASASVRDGDPLAAWQFSSDKKAGLLEFKSAEDATVAVAFSGLVYLDTPVVIVRPKDYVVPEADPAAATLGDVDQLPQVVPDSPEKISIANIPLFLEEEQILELLKEFGALKNFVLLRDKQSGESKGVAFCEFVDSQMTDAVCDGLSGMELGDQPLVVRRACIGVKQLSSGNTSLSSMAALANSTASDSSSTCVLQLLNMIVPDDLNDDDEYEDIKDDVREECEKFGPIVDLKIPRQTRTNQNPSGVGKIFVRFENPESCSKALKALAGRKFADRTVVTTFFPEVNNFVIVLIWRGINFSFLGKLRS